MYTALDLFSTTATYIDLYTTYVHALTRTILCNLLPDYNHTKSSAAPLISYMLMTEESSYSMMGVSNDHNGHK